MKTTLKIMALLTALILSVTAFSPKKTTTFKIDPSKSKLTWTGKKVTGEHTGEIKIKEGTLTLEGNKIKSGNFVIDMNTITNTDLTDKGYNEKLINHLKSDDFFSTSKFPEAKLVIKTVSPGQNNTQNVKADLTIKGITKPIEFPATITNNGSGVKATAKIAVDRAKYDVKYGSGSFFDNLGDKAIDDIFVLDIALEGNK